MIEGGQIISGDIEVAEKWSNYFENAVKSLDILECKDILATDIAIKKYEMHPSILTIKGKVPFNLQGFSFTQTDLAEMEKEIKALNAKKASTYNNIPTKI